MHFTLAAIVILAGFSVTYSHPAASDEPGLLRARPIQTFFKNIFNAMRRTTTEAPPPLSTTRRMSSNVQIQEIPNFIDFSTYLLSSFASNNSAIKFSYMQPNMTAIRATNYSVISFVVPNDDVEDGKQKGIFSFLNSIRLPWNRAPSNTDFSQFPPFLEYFTQRVQAYFSVYKFSDDSRVNNTIVFFMPDGLTDNSAVGQINDETEITTNEADSDEDNLLRATTTLQDDDATTEVIKDYEDSSKAKPMNDSITTLN